MIRIYWNTPRSSEETVVFASSCNQIQHWEGGWWFAEDDLQSSKRSVFEILDRICPIESSCNEVLELLKPLPDNFIHSPCWKGEDQTWHLHSSKELVQHQVLEPRVPVSEQSEVLHRLVFPFEAAPLALAMLPELPLSDMMNKLVNETVHSIESNYRSSQAVHESQLMRPQQPVLQNTNTFVKEQTIPRSSGKQKGSQGTSPPSHPEKSETRAYISPPSKAIQSGVLCSPMTLPKKSHLRKSPQARKEHHKPPSQRNHTAFVSKECLIDPRES